LADEEKDQEAKEVKVEDGEPGSGTSDEQAGGRAGGRARRTRR